MGRYVTPGRCLDCQTLLPAASPVCPACGLPQTGPHANTLRTRLEQADVTLARLRRSSAWAPDPAVVAPGAPHPSVAPDRPLSPSMEPMSPYAPLLPPMEPKTRGRTLPAVSTPMILLGLGALCFLVAAIVFVTVNWSDLSLAAKAAILLGITALIGAAGVVSLKRGLRGSSETFSTLFAVFVVLDFISAWVGDLAGVESLSLSAARTIGGVLAVASGVGWAVFAQRSAVKTLIGVQIVAALGFGWLCAVTFDQLEWRTEYVALALTVVTCGLAWAASRLSLKPLALACVALAAIQFAVAWVASLAWVVLADDLDSLWGSGEAVGWLICCAVLAAATVVRRVPNLVAAAAATMAATGVTLLALRPLEGSSTDVILSVTGAVGLALAAVFAYVVVRGPWHIGIGVASAGAGLVAAGWALPWPIDTLSRLLEPADRFWELSVDSRVNGLSFDLEPVTPFVVLGAILAVALTAWLLTLMRLPSIGSAVIVTSSAIATVTIRQPLPMWQPVAIMAALSAVCVVVAAFTRRTSAFLAALVCIVLTLISSLGSEVTTLVVAAAISAVLFALVGRPLLDDDVNQLVAGSAVVMGGLGVVAALAVADRGRDVTAVTLGLIGAGVLAAVQTRRAGAPMRARLGFEVGAAVLLVVAMGLAVEYVDVVLPVTLTLTGVGLALAGLLSNDRRLLLRPAAVFLAAATWVRLASQDVTVIEAYTLPSAVALCAAGVWRMRRTPDGQTMLILGPGLTLAMLPSLLAAIPEPTSLRALLLGLGALAVLGAGAALRWAAPLLLGSGVVLVLALVNIAPYAEALPRWVLFATVGAVLLFLGVSWEHRMRDVRTFASAVQRLH